jgi:hypothetical protein
MPLSVLFENFQRGELVSPDMEFEEYEAQLADAGPSFDEQVPDVSDEVAPDNSLLDNIRSRLGL